MVKRGIMWGLENISLSPSVNKIIHPTFKKAKPPRAYIPGPVGGGENKYNTKRECHTHAVSQLKGKNRRFFRDAIQKHEIFPWDVPNPKFDDSHKEGIKYIFTGKCVGGCKCMRTNSHTSTSGAREESLIKFRK